MKYINTYNTELEYTSDSTRVYPNVSYVKATNEVKWNRRNPNPDYSEQYLTFEALESGTFTFTLPANVGSTVTSVSYSTDGGTTWTDTTTFSTSNSTTITTPTINANDKVLWKGVSTSYTVDTTGSTFSSTGTFNVEGNIMSMIYGDNFASQTTIPESSYMFRQLFANNSNLISAENLILQATTLARSCYNSMFYGCTSLTKAPTLPATTLVNNCYQAMFQGCTSLTTAPVLPAATLTDYCYYWMFRGCTLLSTIKMYATDITASNCLYQWVQNVAAEGTFFKKNITIPTGDDGIPSGWTVLIER